MFVEVLEPGHKGLVIVCAEVVPVFHNEEILNCCADLRDGGKHGMGEDVFVDPGFGAAYRFVAANGMEKKKAVVCEAACDRLHVCFVVF